MLTPAPFVPIDEPGGGSGPQLGRFSRQGRVSSLLEQATAAYEDARAKAARVALARENGGGHFLKNLL